MLYQTNSRKIQKEASRSKDTENAYNELAKFISDKFNLSVGKLKVGFKRYGLKGLFDNPHEFGLSADQKDELELIYILSTKDLNKIDKAVN